MTQARTGFLRLAIALISLGVLAAPSLAQQVKVAVINVNRIMTESTRGKTVLEAFERMQAVEQALMFALGVGET